MVMKMNELPAPPAAPAVPMSASPPLLQAQGIRKRFGSHEVLQGVEPAGRQGDVMAMIGASGSGKSTFLRCLNLLEQPNAGSHGAGWRAAAAGAGARRQPARRRCRPAAALRSRVAMVFQHFNLWAHMTALANVIEAPMQVLGLSRAEALERAEQLPAARRVWHRRTPTRRTCRAASSSAWPSRARWPWSRR
jgi:arginine/ornithine transport system ATP-binding protein